MLVKLEKAFWITMLIVWIGLIAGQCVVCVKWARLNAKLSEIRYERADEQAGE